MLSRIQAPLCFCRYLLAGNAGRPVPCAPRDPKDCVHIHTHTCQALLHMLSPMFVFSSNSQPRPSQHATHSAEALMESHNKNLSLHPRHFSLSISWTHVVWLWPRSFNYKSYRQNYRFFPWVKDERKPVLGKGSLYNKRCYK